MVFLHFRRKIWHSCRFRVICSDVRALATSFLYQTWLFCFRLEINATLMHKCGNAQCWWTIQLLSVHYTQYVWEDNSYIFIDILSSCLLSLQVWLNYLTAMTRLRSWLRKVLKTGSCHLRHQQSVRVNLIILGILVDMVNWEREWEI